MAEADKLKFGGQFGALANADKLKFGGHAKYYRDPLVSNFGASKLHSVNLYQMFAYLRNQETADDRTRFATGILLYPRIDRNLDLTYSFGEMSLLVKTVDLGAPWREIERRLLGMIS